MSADLNNNNDDVPAAAAATALVADATDANHREETRSMEGVDLISLPPLGDAGGNEQNASMAGVEQLAVSAQVPRNQSEADAESR
jgi:hypothetical protein